MTGQYQFRVLRGEEAEKAYLNGTSQIRGLCPFNGEAFALTYGRLLTLFGQPTYMTIDLENQYQFALEAKDERGELRYLYAYSGPTGPAVGGGQDDLDCLAADQLAELIQSSTPSDYDYTGYYLDAPCKVHMGVKEGQAFYEESELTDEEFNKIARDIYGN